ncbi:DUF4160 domain-containing protein [Sandaracinobacteroides saxicola]|uniref:DUF4160 domain-containing protein n=1 Tax=Sandaracinobacteroides saxicola TaxID=2759707 RepID=A0A7G5IKG4_9SPHN|nr:DUF4160 domain-containing protein [Sandaracinobacteroides saxicola]QMW23856.1 DUF4160 domain-containing protein [Sandaracinobacteroides saxicola]
MIECNLCTVNNHAPPDAFRKLRHRLFFADHTPPHFHILGRKGAAKVRIDTRDVMMLSGKLDLREPMAWAQENQALLMQRWQLYSGDSA